MKHEKMASFTSFYQIEEIDTDMKTAQPEPLNEEKMKQGKIQVCSVFKRLILGIIKWYFCSEAR
jgi:hypothetical protein